MTLFRIAGLCLLVAGGDHVVSAQPLESANAERPSVCLSASTGDGVLVSADNRAVTDSVKDLNRALSLLERRHKFDLVRAGGACTIKLIVLRRVEDAETETCTVVTRLMAAARDGAVHDEELQATEGTWRGAASTIAGKVAFFVDRNSGSLGLALPVDAAPATTAAPAEHEASAATPQPAPTSSDPAPERQRAAAPSPGARTIEDGLLDWVRLNGDDPRSLDTPVYMRLFTTGKADLGTGSEGGKDTRTAEAKTLQTQGPALLRESFLARASTAGVKVINDDAAASLPPDAIIIEGEFVTIDPGSRAKRYWVGFGAGKSSLEVAGRLLTPTGTVLGEFRHRRIGAMGMGGGDSLGKLLADTRSCGEDLAKFMRAWLAGSSLK